MKKLFTFLSVAIFAMVFFWTSTIKAEAAEPTTYCVRYDAEEEEWYYQVGSKWDDSVPPPNRELYYMTLEMKDGDYVVVESTDGDCPELKLDFHLGNLTTYPNVSCLINAKSIAECYLLHGSYVSITADVEHAWVYQGCTANFNKNCNKLELIYIDNPNMSVGVLGICNEFSLSSETEVVCELWSFKDDLIFKDGVVQTDRESYSTEPPATSPAPVVPTTPNTTPSNTPPAPSSSSTSADEYDDVPKTEENMNFLWFFAIAGLCFVGSYSLNKKF